MIGKVKPPKCIQGDLSTLARISFPLMLFLFCEALVGLAERIFLSRYSLEALHASVSGSYLGSLFQVPCVAIASMAQVFVGLHYGKEEFKKIGPCVWQMIWFSLLSLLFTLPLSYGVSRLYFKGVAIGSIASDYFTIFSWGNFLFPLQMTLLSFYLARGKTFLITTLMLGTYALNIFLSWALTLGMGGIIPRWGTKGAALATCISLAVVCTVFFALFLSKENRSLYATHMWKFSPSSLWTYMKPGMVRAFAYLSSKVQWVAVTYLMIQKGGEYLNVVTVGGTVLLFSSFIWTGMQRAVLTVTSNLVGNKNYQELGSFIRSATLFSCLIAAVWVVPMFLFSHPFIYFFDPSSYPIFETTFSSIQHWLWLYTLMMLFNAVFCAMAAVLCGLKYQFYCYLLLWVTTFFPSYFILYVKENPAPYLWLIMALESGFYAGLFLMRVLQVKKREEFLHHAGLTSKIYAL